MEFTSERKDLEAEIVRLMDDLEATVNGAELARRQFRDIAVIAGLVFRGYPGQPVKDRHLQGSSSLLFDVLAFKNDVTFWKNNISAMSALREGTPPKPIEGRWGSAMDFTLKFGIPNHHST